MWYDVVCLVILALSVWRGLVKGFVWQLATIAGLVICFVFAETVSLAIAPMTGLQEPLSRWVSILGLYIVGSFVAFAIARTIKGGLEKAKFDDYDRHLGAIFGAIKGAIICLVVSFFMFTMTENTRETVIHSNAGYASAVLFEQIYPVLPGELEALLEPYMDGFDKDSIAKHKHDHPVGNGYLGSDTHDHEEDHDDHDGHDHGDSSVTPLPNPFGNNNNSTPSPTIQQMVQQIPGLFGEDLQQIVYKSIENTSPEDRADLIKELSTGMPGLIRQVADQWKNGRPPEVKANTETDWKQHRATLLKEIAGVYSDHLDAQQSIMEEVVYALQGVPDSVTVAVLEDWHADLLKNSPDPDPTTDLYTRLDQRVFNQLNKARISLGSLPSDLQNRLSNLR
ncbi:CvpA family protein [Rubinisphaera italica]|uniref:Colicin V production protein n=1 Tax=Rubinisphaera italica TaxID=2527969 RepID=A0A5C5XFS1_9PLAN|nr:CvpA family protein [Rubinisphaera italica]TWT61966.1 colicin V production protein [Rubinisphaera italica]